MTLTRQLRDGYTVVPWRLQAALSVAMVPLRDRGGEIFVFVGTVKDMTLHPRQLSASFIHVYQFSYQNTTLTLVHKTPVEDVPYALAGFSGRLVAGVGNRLRIYGTTNTTTDGHLESCMVAADCDRPPPPPEKAPQNRPAPLR